MVEKFVRIPHTQLEPDTLRALVEDYVTRNGTDYGAVEIPLDKKIGQVLHLLITGQAFIVYETQTETCNILPSEKVKGSRR